MLLAEERGEVGGQRVGKGLPLVGQVAFFQCIEVIAERAEVDHTQAAGQPAIDHFTLAVGQRDADAPVDQVADAAEIFGGE